MPPLHFTGTRQIQTPSDTESDSDLTYIVYIVLGVLFVITVSLIAILLTLLKRLKRTKPQQYQSVIRRIHVGSIRLREGFRTSSRRENRIEAVPSRSVYRYCMTVAYTCSQGIASCMARCKCLTILLLI